MKTGIILTAVVIIALGALWYYTMKSAPKCGCA